MADDEKTEEKEDQVIEETTDNASVKDEEKKVEADDNNGDSTKDEEDSKPQKVEATAEGIESGAKNEPETAERILVVEDSPPLRRMLEKILTNSGYIVDTAENGEKAIEKLSENPCGYSVMTLDIMMPVLDGIKTMAKIKKDDMKGIPPVIICSCRSDKETVVLSNKLGVSGYILKPFKTETVISKVREIIEAERIN